MNRKGARVSPWGTPVVISKNNVSPSGDLTIERVFLYSIIITLIISVGITYSCSINSILFQFIELNAFQMFMNCSVIGSFFYFTPSSMRRIFKMCPDFDLFFCSHFDFPVG